MRTFRPHALLAAALVACPMAARAQIAVMGSSVQERKTAPGEVYTGTILVTNPSARPEDAKIYQTDYLFFADGTAHYDDPGTLVRSNARWMSVGPAYVTIPPGQTVRVQYTVQVPADDALSGTYWSMVMVEGVPKEPARTAADSERENRPHVALRPIIRYGVQVVSHIRETGVRKMEFVAPHIDSTADGKALEFDIRNTGERAYRLDVWVELYDEHGTQQGKLQQARGLIYPGSSIRQRFDLSKVPLRTYKALIVADTGDDDVFGAQYKFRL